MESSGSAFGVVDQGGNERFVVRRHGWIQDPDGLCNGRLFVPCEHSAACRRLIPIEREISRAVWTQATTRRHAIRSGPVLVGRGPFFVVARIHLPRIARDRTLRAPRRQQRPVSGLSPDVRYPGRRSGTVCGSREPRRKALPHNLRTDRLEFDRSDREETGCFTSRRVPVSSRSRRRAAISGVSSARTTGSPSNTRA